ncbi:MAG: site-specific integrase [Sumerlaeia bacterium]
MSALAELTMYQSRADANLFEARLRGSGGYLRRRVRAESLDEAITAARRAYGLEREAEGRQISLADAFMMTIDASRRVATRQQWLDDAAKFVDWLATNHPLCLTWAQVTRTMVRSYITSLGKKAPNTIRIPTQPLRQTSRFMAREYELKDIAAGLGSDGTPVRETSDVLLEDVGEFVDWIRDNRPWMEVGPALQGLAGLQLQEALRLTWDKVDLDRGIIEISGVIKNDYRERTIPVCGRVLDALRRAHEHRCLREQKRGVVDVAGHVVVDSDGRGYKDHKAYSRRVRDCRRAWNSDVTWPPKDLRNCLVTFCEDCGLQTALFEQYVGHAAKTVSDMSYKPRRLATFTKAERTRQEHALDVYRRLVIEPIEAGLRGQRPRMVLQLSCNSTANTDQEAQGPLEADRCSNVS